MTSTPVHARRSAPLVPVLSLAAFVGGRHAALPSLLDNTDIRLVTSGRIAIGLALRALGVGAGDVVLVPAYHSPSMVPPAHWCGADVRFYRVRPDTAPDLADIEAQVAKGRVKAILATHFFGIPHDLAPLRALCDRHGIGLVEDCAHCFFGARDGIPVGSLGDYAIGSTMKFFPVYEGGCLVSRRHRLDVVLRGAGVGFEMKAALNALEAAFRYGRLPLLRILLALPVRVKSALWTMLKSRARKSGHATVAAVALAPSSSDSSFEFDARWTDKRSSRFSSAILHLVSPARIVARRRRNYIALQQALDGAPGCRPLFPRLPDGACPWMFPLLVDQPQAVSEALQRARVPMTRFGATLWPGIDASVCANSVDLGRRVIAFPCHQALDDAERAWLHGQIRKALESCAAVPA